MTAMPAAWRNEQAFAEGVIHLAQNCGWIACHFRPARTAKGWVTAIVGDKGAPDIWAVHSAGLLVFAELKMHPATQSRGRPEPAQQRWLDALEAVAINTDVVRVFVWRPEDYDREIVPVFTGALRAGK